jgi:hypothetical protein
VWIVASAVLISDLATAMRRGPAVRLRSCRVRRGGPAPHPSVFRRERMVFVRHEPPPVLLPLDQRSDMRLIVSHGFVPSRMPLLGGLVFERAQVWTPGHDQNSSPPGAVRPWGATHESGRGSPDRTWLLRSPSDPGSSRSTRLPNLPDPDRGRSGIPAPCPRDGPSPTTE